LVNSAQDISDGGLAVALAECCFEKKIGATIKINSAVRIDSLLFGESQSRVLVSAIPANGEKIIAAAQELGLKIQKIGSTGGDKLIINEAVSVPIAKLYKTYEEAIPKLMEIVTRD
jgi:phosphoribosylformylglycinamidine synthase